MFLDVFDYLYWCFVCIFISICICICMCISISSPLFSQPIWWSEIFFKHTRRRRGLDKKGSVAAEPVKTLFGRSDSTWYLSYSAVVLLTALWFLLYFCYGTYCNDTLLWCRWACEDIFWLDGLHSLMVLVFPQGTYLENLWYFCQDYNIFFCFMAYSWFLWLPRYFLYNLLWSTILPASLWRICLWVTRQKEILLKSLLWNSQTFFLQNIFHCLIKFGKHPDSFDFYDLL